MLISSAHAQAAAAPSGGGYEQIFIMIAMFAVLYFIMIRPQQKKAKEHKALVEALAKGDEVRLVGFGTFATAKRKASTGRNPRTGEAMTIKASTQPKFKAGKGLKDAVN